MLGTFLLLVMLCVPIIFVVGLLIRSATILVGQMRRQELLSLSHVHIVVAVATLFDIYVCFNNVRLSSLSQTGESFVWITNLLTSIVLVVLPYGALMLYRLYQRQHSFSLPQKVGLLADRKGIRDAILVTVCVLAVSAMALYVPHLPRETFIHAAETHNTRLVEKLLALGADPNVKTMGGSTPLVFACRNNDVEMIRLLLGHGADVNYSSPILALEMAARHSDLRAFNLILDQGVNVNASIHFTTALAAVAREGTPAAVRLLLEKGADVNAQTLLDQTALMNACGSGNTGAVAVLLEYGADVNVATKTGQTALISACWWKPKPEMVKALLEKGADVNARQSVNGKTPLMLAAEKGSTELLGLLLAAGSDVNARDNQNNTAMSLATKARQAKAVELLRKHGANQ